MKRIFTLITVLVISTFGFGQSIAGWNFFGESSPTTSTPDTYDVGLLPGSNTLTRGTGAASSAASNSFRTVGFQNNGIATTNTDYFQFSLAPGSGYTMSLTTINARLSGTNSFSTTPGVSQQFAYSTDGVNFTLIASAVAMIGNGAMAPVDLSTVPALQNVATGTTITFRFYASGQTTTGGWGFTSPTNAVADNGLDISGVVLAIAPVKLTTFQANTVNNTVNLNWKVAQEVGIKNYEVEKSNDGITFNKVGTVNATGNPTYNYNDTYSNGISYYKLKINETNGATSYSATLKIKNNGKAFNLNNIYPTPATSTLTVNVSSTKNGTVTYTITDINGKIVANNNLPIVMGTTDNTINVTNLKAGMYYLKLVANGVTINEKFVKQ